MRKQLQSMSVVMVMAIAAGPMIVHGQDNNTTNHHAVFVMTNAADKNEVIAYQRSKDGSLRETQRIPTGGRGSGGNNDPLESQGSLTLSGDHSLLFAVNASSGEVSVFRVEGSTLSIYDKVRSLGSMRLMSCCVSAVI